MTHKDRIAKLTEEVIRLRTGADAKAKTHLRMKGNAKEMELWRVLQDSPALKTKVDSKRDGGKGEVSFKVSDKALIVKALKAIVALGYKTDKLIEKINKTKPSGPLPFY